ncbi:MAG: nicotinamide riboside transporter PnuC [Nannocystaceae bacterium]|nr:nicotinamide riboside transporter PnuC [Nannocystaceae bacterium]
MSALWQQVLATSALEWFGTVTGLVAVGLSIRQHRLAWPLFIACYAAYVWLSADAGLVAAAAMNGVFIVLSIEGWRSWKPGEDEEAFHVRPGSLGVWVSATGAWVGVTAAIAILLLVSGKSEAPFLDATATAAGFVAQWLLTRKRAVTWAFWLISDVAFMVLYGRAGYGLTVGLFAVFVGLALHGAYTWSRASSESP